MVKLIISVTMVPLVVACTWVKPSEDAKQVALVKPTVAQNCQNLGRTTSKVPDRVGIFARGERKVNDELITLAKNQAAEMGGDTIVAETPVSKGSQSFGVYKCLQ